jgi:chitin biosynthesis protein CHS5
VIGSLSFIWVPESTSYCESQGSCSIWSGLANASNNLQIEFPSVLLPHNIISGSIVDINVSHNHVAEAASVAAFQTLQKRILHTYGIHPPSPPVLRLRNATQTSLVLEWDTINLATASLKSLSLYRNGSKAGSIPRPLEILSTKISGLAIHTEYMFHLVLRTSAGTYQSEKLTCRTHKMTDLSGITVTPGILPPQLRESLARAVDRIGGKVIDTVRIDTTHFVCIEGKGSLWEKAVEMNIPVVRPEWVEACEAEGTIVSVRGYYLNADPRARHLGPRSISLQQHPRFSSTTSTAASPPIESQSPPSLSKENPDEEPPVTPFPSGVAGTAPNGLHEDTKANGSNPSAPPPEGDPAVRGASKSIEDESQSYEGGSGDGGQQPESDETTPKLRREQRGGRDEAGEGELDEVPL